MKIYIYDIHNKIINAYIFLKFIFQSMRYGLSRAPEPAATPPSSADDNFVRNIWPTCLFT